jgi:hypothetical protein
MAGEGQISRTETAEKLNLTDAARSPGISSGGKRHWDD